MKHAKNAKKGVVDSYAFQ